MSRWRTGAAANPVGGAPGVAAGKTDRADQLRLAQPAGEGRDGPL